MRAIEDALEALRRGRPVMIYDSSKRESEVDMVYHASNVGPDEVYMLRTRAGGLICYATTAKVVEVLGLRFLDEALKDLGKPYDILASKTPSYGDRPAFILWVNHVKAKTGITDEDRALTIRGLHEVTKLVLDGKVEKARRAFTENFQSPGHVPLLAARSLKVRRGHTELSIALAKLARLEPSVVFAEMLVRGGRLSWEDAKSLSERTGWPLLEGAVIVEACRDDPVCWSD
jgi:3,4-dihydroxy 2-butanone 4-phosphate synthase